MAAECYVQLNITIPEIGSKPRQPMNQFSVVDQLDAE
jgi:hypothetical protein